VQIFSYPSRQREAHQIDWDWNQLPGGVIGTTPLKTHIFKKRVKKAKPMR
jgi:hypothetical protein